MNILDNRYMFCWNTDVKCKVSIQFNIVLLRTYNEMLYIDMRKYFFIDSSKQYLQISISHLPVVGIPYSDCFTLCLNIK